MSKASVVCAGLIAVLFVGAAIFAQYKLLDRDLEPPVLIERWLPKPGEKDGPVVDTISGDFSFSSLRAAVREQFRIAQALDEVQGPHLWFGSGCSISYLNTNWYNGPSTRLRNLAIGDVTVTSFADDRATVRLSFRYVPNPRLDINADPEAEGAEFWYYTNGTWRNTSCAYFLGSPLDGVFARLHLLDYYETRKFFDLARASLRPAVVDTAASSGWAAGCVWKEAMAPGGAAGVVQLLDLSPADYRARNIANAPTGARMVVIDLSGHSSGGAMAERRGTGYDCFYLRP